MASTFSSNKLYELMATGEKSGTWGTVANSNVFSIIDANLGGRLSVDCSGNSNITISDTQAKNLYHTLTGLLTGSIQYIVPTRGSFYIITNSTTGAFSVTVIQASGTGVVIPQGSTALVFVNPDGTPTVTIPQNYLSALILASALPVASGGTGGITAAAAMANLGTAVTLTAGTGLTGGGDISTSRSFAFANVADKSILANITGGSAVPSANTLTAIIDAVIGSAQGDILYRDAAAWKVLAPGTSGNFLQTAGAAANPVWAAPATVFPVSGTYSKLKITNNAGTPNTKIDLTANAVTISTVGGTVYQNTSVSLTINGAVTGANGLDANDGALAGSAFYYVYVIYNPVSITTAGMISTNSTAPVTLPAGYTAYARFGSVLTDSAVHFHRTLQYGRIVQYVVTGSSPTLFPPVMASGTNGSSYSATNPTYVSVSTTGFIPPTASRINLLVTNNWKNGTLANVMIAPSTSYGGSNNGIIGSVGLIPPVFQGSSATNATSLWLVLEASSIGYVSDNTGAALACLGWEDNL